MKIHDISTSKPKSTKRVGRGIGSGYGKTAGRGTKGQNSRAGGGVRIGFEGGQNPLAKRLPKKRGFTAKNRVEYQVVGIGQLQVFKAKQVVTPAELVTAGIAKNLKMPIKLLNNGSIDKAITIKVHAASQSAIRELQKTGATIELINQ